MRYIALKETSMTLWHALCFIPGCGLFTASIFGFAFKEEVLHGQSLVELSLFAAGGVAIGIMTALSIISETQNLYFDTEQKVMTYTEPLSFFSRAEMYTIGRPQRVYLETYKVPLARYAGRLSCLHIQCGNERSPTDFTVQTRTIEEATQLAQDIARVSGCNFDRVVVSV